MSSGVHSRKIYKVLLASGIASLGCGDGDHRRSCSVEGHGDGSATISCDDGTMATVAAGEDGAPGVPGAPGDDGEPGEDGVPGVDGEDGADASPCTIANGREGRPTIVCPDGTSVELAGVAGNSGGAGGAGNAGSIFYGASSFTVAFAQSQDPVSFSSTGDYAYIPEGEPPFYNFLLVPVRLPSGANVRSMTCRFYDNTQLADLEGEAALIEKPLDSESGVERIRLPMGGSDFVFSQIQSVVSTPSVPLQIDDDTHTYFIRIYWFTGDTASSAVRFYGCGLDYES